MKSVPEQIVEKCTKMHEYVTTAESCTGGMTASSLVDVPGCSGIYKEGYITYSNGAKEKLLGVSAETLRRHGAVSRECACEMAEGAAHRAHCRYAVSTTGIAGPDGGTKDKPVGLVYIACYAHGETFVYRNQFAGNRSQIRRQAARKALEILNEHIEVTL